MQYEGWTGINPELHYLRNFGALVTALKPGKRPEKSDRHKSHGVLLGFGSSKNIEKLTSHHVIDEAYYGNTRRPAGAQVLVDIGYGIPSLPLVLLQPLKPSVHHPVGMYPDSIADS
jgi:hypothetical protein